MRAYEIHTFQAGKWQIDSVFDDRELALVEAGRMDEGGRYAGIRVVEEEFDELTEKTKVRTIFRGSKVAQENAAALEKSKETRKAQASQGKMRQQAEAARAGKARNTNPYLLIGLFAVITLLGIGAVIGLRSLYGIM